MHANPAGSFAPADVTPCQGCDGQNVEQDPPMPTRRYRVTYTNGTAETVEYCEECALLAEGDRANFGMASVVAVA